MRIDVSSGQETEIAEHLVKKLEQMGFAITRDEPGLRLAAWCGNILAVREGERDGVVLFLFPYGPCAGRHWNQTGGGGWNPSFFGRHDSGGG